MLDPLTNPTVIGTSAASSTLIWQLTFVPTFAISTPSSGGFYSIVYLLPLVGRAIQAVQEHRSIEETRIYQDLERQTKLKASERFLGMGYSISEVAKAVDLSVEEVTKLASNPSEDSAE